ncbi:FliG C-terminal domain-containing protein [Hyphomonas johnsonii]|jgi:flagellar motor switch protein FliG|uniref:Flagellar motor switch protein FliG n=1 Tax=Hyphomonas johnsonii MHS-2 TaxID=1280950 RepID=A0A059FP23_9PROT|nr:FliG C-terminal domain-containing protein [Hyphomonas johnsonii]KCZ92213.1 putative flagellar motor switch protein [Hyphomonas johnsonii MHS-2]
MNAIPKPELGPKLVPQRTDTPPERAPRVSSITPSQRAAVIIAILGEAAAKPIVDKLDDSALAKVAIALEDLSFVARDEMVDIAIDFLSRLRDTNGALRGGKGKAREVLANVLDPARLIAILGEQSTNAAAPKTADGPWTRLEQRDPAQIAQYLNGLSPNIIALILRKLNVTVASSILGQMDSSKLEPAMGFLVEGRKPDPGIDLVLARMIEMEFLNVVQVDSGVDAETLEAVGELLSLIPSDRRDSLVKFLATQHEDKLAGIQKSLFTIEGLPELLSKRAVPIVFREMPEEMTLKLLDSLKSAFPEVFEYLLANVSSRLADKLRDDLSDFESLPPEQGETIQREFLTFLMTMKRNGLIEIDKPGSTPASA